MMKIIASILLLTSAMQAIVAFPSRGLGLERGTLGHGVMSKRWGGDCGDDCGGNFVASNNCNNNNQNCNTEAECCHKLEANVCCDDNQAFSTCNDHCNNNNNNFVSDTGFCKKSKRWGGDCSPCGFGGWGGCGDNDCGGCGGGSFVAANNDNSNRNNCNRESECCHKLSANVCCEDNQACQSCNDCCDANNNNFVANNNCRKAKRWGGDFGSCGFSPCDDFSNCGSGCEGFGSCEGLGGCEGPFSGCEGPFNGCGFSSCGGFGGRI